MPADDPEYFHDVFTQEIGSTGALHDFTQISRAPIASGMVAQVHLGVMEGKEVVIKLQHKGVEDMMISQLRTLFRFSEMLLKSGFDIGFDHHGIITDYLQQLPREFDFRIEAQMAGKIRASLRQHQLEDPSLNLIYIPRMYPDISTDKVLIQEYVNGVPILDTRELNNRFELMQSCVKFFGYLILIDGRFPCDPHSGNLLARSVEGKCELVMIDFGQVREIDLQARTAIARIILALADRDDERIKQELHDAGIAVDGCSRRFLATVGYILFDTRMDIMRAFHRSGLTSDQTRKYQDARVPELPMSLYVVVRVITLLRGIVATLDLDISSAKLWKPLAKKKPRHPSSPVLETKYGIALSACGSAKRGQETAGSNKRGEINANSGARVQTIRTESCNVDERHRPPPEGLTGEKCDFSGEQVIHSDENPASPSHEPKPSHAEIPMHARIGSVGLMREFWEAKSPKAPKLSSNKKPGSATPFSSNPLYNSDVHSSVHLVAPLSRNGR
ncbi:hypothetical protein BSKO_02309 [Bryopsis sp. KO-2023]|nr:hypothetical protein BSKO_02309 [Bryopsis sp. KO-2023]